MTDQVVQPGIIRIEITADDEDTALRAGAKLDSAVWETTGPTGPYRVPGEDGVRVRLYARIPGSTRAEPGPLAAGA